ncbi:hypothetical protein KVG29_11020 [Caldicoprobacter algeriensis]|uniref:hypothetical protein n=1 Tax=Caldicoprobacter algeriensis TaxID=699281 RepID=UPI00207A95A7|nr:hypothetical protein [Caldicoprobacter algeriensis]MCM8901748.1 hypothetical protein [Caldicoprobacter algeriensis]
MQKGIMNSLHSVKEEVKEGMLKSYIAVSNRVKDFFADKKAVSHLLEVVGVLALAALILVVIFPGARDTIKNVWNDMIGNITTTLNTNPGSTGSTGSWQ